MGSEMCIRDRYYGVIDFYIGFLAGIKAFTAAVLGGIGSIPGAIVGGIIIGIVEQLCGTYEYYLFEGVREISAYLVLILTLIIYPRGLFSDKAEVKKV